ncbi:MAG: YebC/PmpR family DNA-binding transcriptional regulator [Patescibacteria group bacterium]|nr:YebC/PmpR family DNA-binding transcriptional regulator [Patescibacteria group bacterium]
MSGHSKWSTIKRAKGVKDAKRGAIFTKLGNLITIAAKDKGADMDTNFSLRMAVDKAKTVNMPKDNIERAIKRGTGEFQGEVIEELYYEGIGPASSQVIVKSLTDNKNRSASTVRHIFSKYGGSLGAVMWNFEQKGVVRIKNEKLILRQGSGQEIKNLELDSIELDLIEVGVDDIKSEKEGITVITKVGDLQAVKKYFDNKEVEIESAEIEYIAKDEIKLEDGDVEKYEKFIEELDDCEDVADYYSNVKI